MPTHSVDMIKAAFNLKQTVLAVRPTISVYTFNVHKTTYFLSQINSWLIPDKAENRN